MAKQESLKRSKLSQTEFPNNELEQAERIAQAIWDNFAGKGAAPHEIAISLEMSPTSGTWRNLCGSAIAYGLTEGGYAADQINLTTLGRRIVSPTEEGDDNRARVEAVLQPRVQREFFEKYNKAKFPPDTIGRNVLVSMGLPKDRAERSFEILKENGTRTGIIRETKTGPFVAIDHPVPPKSTVQPTLETYDEEDDETEAVLPIAEANVTPKSATSESGPKQLFVAHGKNRKPLEDLKKILDQFKIPYKVALDEPNKGRPISAKVAELMQECSAGIFIFTKDELFFKKGKDDEFDEVWRPSENVVYELGAASIRWERKIIIVREDGVNFPSDFSDLGYITFKDGEIANKAMEIFKELIGLGLVKVMAA
ncbi:MAG: nucleotide-binding protein [Proteobacteria bacterium]|nr:nucleotide-binding protein [Pseudomonadota bacterium]